MILDALVITCTWARDDHLQRLTKVVERVAPTSANASGSVVLTGLRWFPILPVLYAGTLAAVHEGNFGAVRAIALDAKVRDWNDGSIPILARGNPWRPFSEFPLVAQILAVRATGEDVTPEISEDLWRKRRGNRPTPISDFLHDALRGRFRDAVPDESEYSDLFDRAETLLAMLVIDLETQHPDGGIYVDPPYYGRFIRHDRFTTRVERSSLLSDAVEQGEAWPPLKAGLFGGSSERAKATIDIFTAGIREARYRHL